MKINYSMLLAGAAIGGVMGWYYMRKVQVPNAYAIGQANPTTPYTSLSQGQLAQLNQSPGLPSPPPFATVAGNAISGVTQPGSANQLGQQAGTGALLGRGGRLLPIRYRGMGRHG